MQFPHHENEIAQSQALHCHTLAKYWMHNGRLSFKNEKMSKSLGNTFLAKDFINEYSSNILRLVMFQTNYRQPINLTDEFIDSTKTIDNKFYESDAFRYIKHVNDSAFRNVVLPLPVGPVTRMIPLVRVNRRCS